MNHSHFTYNEFALFSGTDKGLPGELRDTSILVQLQSILSLDESLQKLQFKNKERLCD